MRRIKIHFWPCTSQSVEAKDPCLEWGALEPPGHKCSPNQHCTSGCSATACYVGAPGAEGAPSPNGSVLMGRTRGTAEGQSKPGGAAAGEGSSKQHTSTKTRGSYHIDSEKLVHKNSLM